MAQKSEVAMAWFRREEYPAIQSAFGDTERLPGRYEDWEANARRDEARLAAYGFRVVRVCVSARDLLQWARGRFPEVDSQAVSAYADYMHRRGYDQRGRPE